MPRARTPHPLAAAARRGPPPPHPSLEMQGVQPQPENCFIGELHKHKVSTEPGSLSPQHCILPKQSTVCRLPPAGSRTGQYSKILPQPRTPTYSAPVVSFSYSFLSLFPVHSATWMALTPEHTHLGTAVLQANPQATTGNEEPAASL